jgi:hypothetical protein
MSKEAERVAVAAVLLRRTVVGLLPKEKVTSGTTGIEDASFSGEAAITIASSQRSSCTTTWCGFPSVGVAWAFARRPATSATLSTGRSWE